MQDLIKHSHGLILVSGPTGSGKTTTLYSALSELNTPEKKIITIEDPIEYDLYGIQQIQIKPKINFSFAKGLRSVLRHDPDIILIGEIRDSETAKIAIQSALTGHFVFSTLHTNDSAGSIVRLIDMGIEDFLIASSIIGVLSQRLVRKICPECKIKYEPEQLFVENIKQKSETNKYIKNFYKGKGCKFCNYTGFRGRTGLFELMLITPEIRNSIMKNSSSDEIKKIAVSQKMMTLFDYGLEKVNLGITPISEVLRVCTI
jgi:type II secretory ATPase GspE/PulE/Tfp pilus assembly ATPase PilB-like protein